MLRFQHVRMAEWSKAPDSRLRFASLIGGQCENSGPRMRAWVQIPLLTKTFLFWLSVHYYLSAVSAKSHEVAWPSGLRRWFKAPVSSGAWVRIPPLPNFLIVGKNLRQGTHGFEPWTYRTAADCSTTELYPHDSLGRP